MASIPSWRSGTPTLFQKSKELIPLDYHELAASNEITFAATQFVPDDLFQNGDGVAIGSGSSGGYGDVLERDPFLIVEDVKKGIVSTWTARNVYHVALDEQTLEIDLAETERLRAQERDQRRERGKPYQEFMKEWLEKRPSDEILRSYGPWHEGIK